MVLYTDGVTEAAFGEEEYGEGRLVDCVRRNAGRRAHDIVQAVRAEVEAFTGTVAFSDDFTLIVIRVV